MKKTKIIIIATAFVLAAFVGTLAAFFATGDKEGKTEKTDNDVKKTSAVSQTKSTTGSTKLIDGVFGSSQTTLVTVPGETLSETTPGETDTGETTYPGLTEAGGTTKTGTVKKGKVTDYEYPSLGIPSYAEIKTGKDWCLILVNRNYILPENYIDNIDLAPCIKGNSGSLLLDSRVAEHYNEMYLAAKADGYTLTPVSGYRSIEHQRSNLENKIDYYENQGKPYEEAVELAAQRILPPGTSEHNAGLAMDICTASSSDNFDTWPEYKWLSEHAAEYGFVLRYPKDKVDVTQIIYEPWHWRYVGKEAALEMKKTGQCLEEYLGVK